MADYNSLSTAAFQEDVPRADEQVEALSVQVQLLQQENESLRRELHAVRFGIEAISKRLNNPTSLPKEPGHMTLNVPPDRPY